MPARMKNPAIVIPEAMEPIKALLAATHKGGVAPKTLATRASPGRKGHRRDRGAATGRGGEASLEWQGPAPSVLLTFVRRKPSRAASSEGPRAAAGADSR